MHTAITDVDGLNLDFIKVRPVMVPLSYSDRTVLAQGLVNNTLGVMENRHEGNKSTYKFAYPDWITRTNGRATTNNPTEQTKFFDGTYAHFELLKLNNWINSI